MDNKFLIVGLGNPGVKYANTRHNIGFMVVEALNPGATWNSKYEGLFTKSNHFYLKPHTFMNNSGEAVLSAISGLGVHPQKVIVIHDDLDLPIGRVKVKQGGGHGGHNGLRNIDQHIGKDYYRVRVGIGKAEDKSKTLDYVLGQMPQDELDKQKIVIAAIVEAFDKMLSLDPSGFMNFVALKTKDIVSDTNDT